jgi:hypothetical protein
MSVIFPLPSSPQFAPTTALTISVIPPLYIGPAAHSSVFFCGQDKDLTAYTVQYILKIFISKANISLKIMTHCRVTIDVTPYYYTKTVESYRMLIAKPTSMKRIINRHDYYSTLTTIFAT